VRTGSFLGIHMLLLTFPVFLLVDNFHLVQPLVKGILLDSFIVVCTAQPQLQVHFELVQ